MLRANARRTMPEGATFRKIGQKASHLADQKADLQ